MNKKQVKKTIGVRVFKADWIKLRKLAKKNRRTLQDMFGTAVNVADKFLM